jgi:hypothetical protein
MSRIRTTRRADTSRDDAASKTGAPFNNKLPRVPLIPDDILKRHGVFCGIDSRFRRTARLLQSLWLKDHGIPADDFVPEGESSSRPNGFTSNLSAEAADAGKNFLTPAIHHLALRELLLREEGAFFDEDRLFGNALSSRVSG